MENLVKIENNEVVVNSREVAQNFSKEHKNVLVNIREILVAENSAAKFFHEVTYENRGKQYPEYLMNRDGFSLLVMSFTGKPAMEWKMKYINAFNEMERQLHEGRQISPAEQVARGLIAAKQLLDEANKTIAIMQPKADFYDEVIEADNLLSIADISKILNVKGLGKIKLFEFLRNNDILQSTKSNWNIPYQKYMKYFKVVERKYNAPSGELKVKLQTRVNQKGLDFIRKLVSKCNNVA